MSKVRTPLRELLDYACASRRPLRKDEIERELTFSDDVDRTEYRDIMDTIVQESESISDMKIAGAHGQARDLVVQVAAQFDRYFVDYDRKAADRRDKELDAMDPRELANEIRKGDTFASTGARDKTAADVDGDQKRQTARR